MPRTFTTDELITEVLDRGSIPNTQATGTDDSTIMRYLNDELKNVIMPHIMKYREEYFVVTTRTALVSGQAKYRIPDRAFGMQLRDVMLVDSLTGTSMDYLPKISRELEPYASTPYVSDGTSGFYLEGDYLVMLDENSTGAIQWSYFFRPGELVKETSGRQITGVTLGSNSIDIAAAPAAWATSDKYDIQSGKSGFGPKQWDLTTAGDPDTSITFAEEIDGTVAGTHAVEIGDWVTLAGEAVIPAIPMEYHSILVEAAIVRLMSARGDIESKQDHEREMEKLLARSAPYTERRVKGKGGKVIGSFIGRNYGNYRGGGY